MPVRRGLAATLAMAGLVLCTTAGAEGLGLRATAADDLWPRWQARMLATTPVSTWRLSALDPAPLGRARQDSISLLGDYYFGPQRSGGHEAAGFRATSGLIIGPLGGHALSAFGDAARARGASGIGPPPTFESRAFGSTIESAPYLGLGYTIPPARSGWGFSADIGVAARNGGSAARFGRVFLGTQSLDELVREMRLTPLLNVGVSYSFW